MKFKIEVELDTNEDREIGSELLDLVTLVKQKLEDFNAEDWDDEDEEEEEPEPPKRKYRRRRR
tara:strand:+ start:9667 stop:9855 length:189 start_codon:yes stop_codon:yes gene_type:complete